MMKNGFSDSTGTYPDCTKYPWGESRLALSNVICVDGSSIPVDGDTPIPSNLRNGLFWSSSEGSASTAFKRTIDDNRSPWYMDDRWGAGVPLCVGD